VIYRKQYVITKGLRDVIDRIDWIEGPVLTACSPAHAHARALTLSLLKDPDDGNIRNYWVSGLHRL
jgi:hypothetical protein